MPTANDCAAASAAVGARSTGRHLLHIEGYSHTKALFAGEFIPSQSFTVGGRAWCIWYYPRGAGDDQDGYAALYIAVFLVLDDSVPEPAYAEATFHLLDRAERPVPGCTHSTGLNEYSAAGGARHGVRAFVPRDFLEASGHLVDECFRIRCDVSVRRPWHTEARPDAPPSDLRRHLGDLLASGEGADVTFQVAGETFSAHRSVVAARSPVLKAKLSAGTAAAACVRIDDVAPQVFEALLHFVYTDSLPEAPGQDDVFMGQRLLEAAGRYGVPRLRPICEEKLCRLVQVDTAAPMLLFAQQHRCHWLREACVDFLKCPGH